ncbi:desmethyl-deoxy-podophyllotoxin synthase-like [Miscanthus floridulus]|uniref:desmethyl-deoxy-podophyllotoxin synthase-like n=1 Tax=Miscanthus floridulus TaxID=154761 RepID=UPI003458F313
MEMLTVLVLPLISLVVAVLLFIRVIKNNAGSTSVSTASAGQQAPAPLPPGPSRLPLIGSMHHLATGELPHHALTRLGREHGPVMHLQMGQVGLVVVSSREAAREVTKVQDANFAHRPELTGPKTLLYGCADVAFASGPHWRRLRKMCVVKLLCASRVRSFAPIRREETRALLHGVAGQPPGTAVDLRPMLETMSSAVVSRTVFGKMYEHRGSILKEGLKLTSAFCLSDHFPSLSFLDVPMRLRLRRVHRQVDKLLEDIIAERKRLRQENLNSLKDATEVMLDVLLDAIEQPDMEAPIRHDSIKAVIMDMFVGGTETSSTTIEWALAELIKNPKEMAKVQEEVRTKMKRETDNHVEHLSYLRLVVKETLRLHTPAPLLVPRVCKQECRLGGYTIPAGTRLVINAWAMSRDPSYWEDAETFRPGRFLDRDVDYKGTSFEFLPFGAGRRICPGIEFGLASIELCLAQLLFYFDWKLPRGMAPEDLNMSETSVGVSVVRKEPLRLVPSIHAPLDLKF